MGSHGGYRGYIGEPRKFKKGLSRWVSDVYNAYGAHMADSHP